jgi:hypothetical protein
MAILFTCVTEGIVWAITRLVKEIIWVCFQVYFTTFFRMRPIISENYLKAVYSNIFYFVSFNKICKNMFDLMDLVIYYVNTWV